MLTCFSGQHDCVTVINNFFSRARLDYYTKPQGLEKAPKLPPKLAGPLHKIIMSTNLNPVKVPFFCLIHIFLDSNLGKARFMGLSQGVKPQTFLS